MGTLSFPRRRESTIFLPTFFTPFKLSNFSNLHTFALVLSPRAKSRGLLKKYAIRRIPPANNESQITIHDLVPFAQVPKTFYTECSHFYSKRTNFDTYLHIFTHFLRIFMHFFKPPAYLIDAYGRFLSFVFLLQLNPLLW